MMMSIFSSFDALSAELFGQKLGFSWAKEQQQPKGFQAVATERKTGASSAASGGSSKAGEAAPSYAKKPRQEQRRPRFAPELDGIYCFETIIPS